MKARLGHKIKTVDDLLCQDDVLWLIDRLVKERAKLTGLVVIKIDQQGGFQTLSTFDRTSTIAALSRSTYLQHFMENLEYSDRPEDESKDDS